MITKTFKLTVATDTAEQMQKEEEYLSMTYGAEEVDPEEAKWIPCSEQEPETYGEYLITWTTGRKIRKERLLGFAEYEVTGEYDHEKNRFKGNWLLEEYTKSYPKTEVIAWMPCPGPYKEEEE